MASNQISITSREELIDFFERPEVTARDILTVLANGMSIYADADTTKQELIQRTKEAFENSGNGHELPLFL